MKRAFLFGLLTAACTTASTTHGGATTVPVPGVPGAAKPGRASKLVVVVVIDQLPEWAFEQKLPQLAPSGGFARLLAEGEWHIGRHPSAATLTAPGHALLGTGKPPAYSGILGNEWWSRDDQRVVHAVESADQTRFLRVPGMGDAAARAHDGTKAVAVSLKDRAARLLLGKAGLAVWYDAKSGAWMSSGDANAKITLPAPAPPPAWLAKLPRVSARLAPWNPLDPAKLAKLSGVVDAQPGEVGEKGFGPTFPHDPSTTKDPNEAVFAMPLGNDVVLESALAAIDGEGLGHDKTPDVLFVSLSAHDYIAHGWGHESWEAWDTILRLDASLGEFLDELDRRVGRGQWSLIVTSDHGAAPLPEKTGGGRITFTQLLEAANNAASAELGPGSWVSNAHYPYVFLSTAALAQPKREIAIVIKKIEYALRSFPGIARAGRVDTYAGHCESRTGDEKALCLTFDPQRAGEIFYMPAPNWIMEADDEPLATAHGSLQDYDRNVPLVLLPFGRVPHAPDLAPRDIIGLEEVAPIIASWLGILPP